MGLHDWCHIKMSLLPFWALNMVVALLSLLGQKAFIKYILICVLKMNEGVMVLELNEVG